ncbi:T9SS type A sorting domain-containing protein, partial [bacterium]|nr:T9SS type A sorting domain-containing protein [bacterium]
DKTSYIQIFDIGGRIVASKPLDISDIFDNRKINFNWIPDPCLGSGVYFIRVTSYKSVAIRQVIYLK